MDCYICRDRGLVPFTIKKNDVFYEFFARCKCSKGKEVQGQGFAALSEVFTDFEILEMKKRNREREENKGVIQK